MFDSNQKYKGFNLNDITDDLSREEIFRCLDFDPSRLKFFKKQTVEICVRALRRGCYIDRLDINNPHYPLITFYQEILFYVDITIKKEVLKEVNRLKLLGEWEV